MHHDGQFQQRTRMMETWLRCGPLSLIHDPKLPCSFNCGWWKHGYNPDLQMWPSIVLTKARTFVLDPVPRLQCHPFRMGVNAAVIVSFGHCFNFKRTNWSEFSKDLDLAVSPIELIPENYCHIAKLYVYLLGETLHGCQKTYPWANTPYCMRHASKNSKMTSLEMRLWLLVNICQK